MQPQRQAKREAQTQEMAAVASACKLFMRGPGGRYLVDQLSALRTREITTAETTVDPHTAMKALGQSRAYKTAIDTLNRLAGS